MMHTAEQFYKNRPVLVTGGCGFIGSHLTHALVNLGARVTILDDLSTGSLDNIAPIQHAVTFIHGSITDRELCLLATHGQDVVFHLAASISVPESIINPLDCYTTNITGTLTVLDAARVNKVDRFVFSSSAAVYGKREGACRESDTCSPESPYGYSKQIGELLCAQYTRNYGLKTVCLRYFNVYGPRQNPHSPYAGVVAQFRYKMKHNLPIHLFGDGSQTRDFVPVETVVLANMRLALADIHTMNGQAFNIATGSSITLLSLIDALKKESPGYAGDIIFNPKRPGDIDHSHADCSKYQQAL